MKRALKESNLTTVGAIVMHAPGTVKGDQAELKAIQKCFGRKIPFLTSNKYLFSHTSMVLRAP